MTKQETFDIVCKGIITQGRPARSGGACAYRGTGGTKCAAGFLIPDALYTGSMEGGGLYSSSEAKTAIASQGHDIQLVRHLQAAHDSESFRSESNFVAAFVERARAIALQEGLNTDVLQ